jgi:hypothetical protein
LSDLSSPSIYPWPRKLFAPNDNNLIPNSITNIVKNKGRSLLETTYQGDYSNGEGLGSHIVYDTTATLSSTDKLVKLIFVFLVNKNSIGIVNRNRILIKHSIRQDQLKVCKLCIFMEIIDKQVHLKIKEHQYNMYR